jgi:DNA repair exonuclease SbcCD ATPase subunit
MKIIALEAENVKHLKVVHIKPDGSLVVIGGDNSAGKSCALDSIQYALDGAGSIPDKPIRKGEKKARIKLDLGDIEKEIEVVRTFTPKGTNLVVKNKDGATFPSPQAMLDKLKGELAFDPLEFSRMDAKKQAEVLKKLVGLNFDKVNGQYKDLFDQRTIVNRQGKDLKANLDNMVKHDGALPDQELSIQELGEQYAKALEYNQKIETAKRGLKFKIDELQRLEKEVKALKADIKKRQKSLEGNEETIDDKAIHTRMADAEGINTKVRENKVYEKIDQQLTELREKSGSLGTQMAKIVSHKAKALAKAEFPIEGLAIDDDGVTFEDIPFTQCSTSQQIRISVAIGLAMNPKLRVLLIREGSLLDEKNLEMVAKMADDADAQIWLERVSKGKECQVIIEDGSVLEPEVNNV